MTPENNIISNVTLLKIGGYILLWIEKDFLTYPFVKYNAAPYGALICRLNFLTKISHLRRLLDAEKPCSGETFVVNIFYRGFKAAKRRHLFPDIDNDNRFFMV